MVEFGFFVQQGKAFQEFGFEKGGHDTYAGWVGALRDGWHDGARGMVGSAESEGWA